MYFIHQTYVVTYFKISHFLWTGHYPSLWLLSAEEHFPCSHLSPIRIFIYLKSAVYLILTSCSSIFFYLFLLKSDNFCFLVRIGSYLYLMLLLIIARFVFVTLHIPFFFVSLLFFISISFIGYIVTYTIYNF